MGLRERLRRDEAGPGRAGLVLSPAEAQQLAGVFTPPRWLRDLGRTAWLLVGCAILLVGIAWLVGTASTIFGPLLAASIVATVASPVVARLRAHRIPRAAGAAIVLLAFVVAVVVIAAIVIGGITSQAGEIGKQLTEAVDKLQSWLASVGVPKSSSDGAKSSLEADGPKVVSALTTGVIHGIQGITSVAFALSFSALCLFFLLKDGPMLRAAVDRHLGLPLPVARTVTGNMITSLRGYFLGVTIVAAFNGIVVGIGSLLLGVPLAGTIAVVTFVTAYVPFIGAFVSGAFAVLIALGANGTRDALIMLVLVILANGLLQNIFQPFAMGTALDLHPLVVLVITIASGCILGMMGLVLAAPVASAIVHISRDLARAKAGIAEPLQPGAAGDAPGVPAPT